MNVLRFDYSCTGDSAGDGREASIAEWISDIGWALDELKDNSMAERVTVVGLRWGATLGTLACLGRHDVEHLVLWDPVLSGRTYLDEALGTPRPNGLVGIDGFPFSQQLRDDMDTVDLPKRVGELDVDVSLMVAEDRADYRVLAAALEACDRDHHVEVIPSSGNWAQADPFGDALIPQNIMQGIVDRLQQMAVS
jgi:pimeloyl-ACP methyl ester carboxylesterase